MRILIVDDEKQCADATAELLSAKFQCHVEVAYSGTKAMNILSTTGNGPWDVLPFDVLISDFNMPEVKGDQVCQVMRKKNPEAIIILLSGSLFTDEQLKSFQKNGIKLLVKPFKIKELLELLK